jgi:signal transduction histidine kinase
LADYELLDSNSNNQQQSMIDAHASTSAPALDRRRWICAASFTAAIVVFLAAHRFGDLDEYSATALNDAAWWLACAAATFACFYVSRQLTGRERLAWSVLGLACAFWLAGHVVWTTYELVLGGLPKFPHWMQILFSIYDWLFVAGLWLLPKPPEASRFTPRHGGNLVLIVCTLIVAFIVALFEPAMLPNRNWGSSVVVLLHCLGLASMFVTALYLLWSYPWQDLYWPLVFCVLGAGTHTATYVAYAHQIMTQSYGANEWFNASWLFVFGAYACAAVERLWNTRHPATISYAGIMRRERWLEALIPAMLLATMLSMAWFYSAWLTLQVAGWATLAALAFAAALGLREIWIQRQEQRLLAALNETNANMLTANRELSRSEVRYRSLSTELEQRVNERTKELQQAYRELENFSYAVAHDLKAPLRSVDGFGAILTMEYGARLDEKGLGYLQRMRRSALKMSELIDDLLAYARVERRDFQLSDVQLPALIEAVVAEQRDELDRHGVQLRLNLAPVVARADQDGMLMACRNLLQNAIKFSQHSKPPQIVISVEHVGSDALIAIQDNGVGFDMSHHDKIFEMFQRLHRADEIPGTGIGLAIVRKAVERMDGRVWADSNPGKGATFYLQIPATTLA